MTDIVSITDRARAVLALDSELSKVIRDIEDEKKRHNAKMEALLNVEQGIENAIFKLGGLNAVRTDKNVPVAHGAASA